MLSIIGLSSKSVEQHDEEYRDLEPTAFESCIFIGQRAGSNFHSVPQEPIVSHASVSRENNSNCFHGKKCWARLCSFLSRTLNWLEASPG